MILRAILALFPLAICILVVVLAYRKTRDRWFQFQKRSQLFLRVRNETFSVAAMCVCNPDCSPVGINRWDAAPTAPGFA
jgi:hypothetical protein